MVTDKSQPTQSTATPQRTHKAAARPARRSMAIRHDVHAVRSALVLAPSRPSNAAGGALRSAATARPVTAVCGPGHHHGKRLARRPCPVSGAHVSHHACCTAAAHGSPTGALRAARIVGGRCPPLPGRRAAPPAAAASFLPLCLSSLSSWLLQVLSGAVSVVAGRAGGGP